MIWSRLLRAVGGGSFVSGLGARLGSSPERRVCDPRSDGSVRTGFVRRRPQGSWTRQATSLSSILTLYIGRVSPRVALPIRCGSARTGRSHGRRWRRSWTEPRPGGQDEWTGTWGTGALAAVSATEKRRQNPAEEETDSRDPYHHPRSGVVAKTPQRGLRVLGLLSSRVRGVGGGSGLFQGCSGVFGRGVGCVAAALAAAPGPESPEAAGGQRVPLSVGGYVRCGAEAVRSHRRW